MLRLLGRARRAASAAQLPKSVEGHRPPSAAESVASRYSGVLFSAASRAGRLDVVHAELQRLSELVAAPRVRDFLGNVSHTRGEQREVMGALAPRLDPAVAEFLELLVDARKLAFLPQIIAEFFGYFRALSREEAVRVVSAQPLSAEQRGALEDALRRKLADRTFTVEYEVSAALLGGFHVYFGDRFLDCSLATRVAALRSEFQRLAA